MPGVALLVAGAAVYDAWAIHTHRQTISAGVRQLRRTEAGRIVLAGLAAALIAHLAERDPQ